MSDATLITDRTRPAVRLQRDLPDPPELVWAALTEREQLREWFPCDVIVDGGEWQVGAALSFPFPPDVIEMTLTGEVLAVDEPHALSFTWGDETLHFELSPRAGGTRLLLIDELAADVAARNAAGWEICLDRLAGLRPAGDEWQRRFDSYASAFAPELGPQAGPPSGYKGDDAD